MDYSFPNDYYPAETPNTVAEKYKGLEIALPYPYPPSPTITPGIDLLPYNNSYLLENIDDFFVGGGGSMLQQYLHIPSTNSRDWSIIQSPTPILSLSPLEWLQNISVDLDNYGIPSPRGVVTSNKATSKRKAVAVKKTRVSSSSSTSSLPGQAHYPCHECDSVFTSRKNLNSHSIRHTGMSCNLLILFRWKTFPMRHMLGLVEAQGRFTPPC
jgi:hypothetical protein